MPDAPHGELGHVAERDPADRSPARAEDLRRALREIEAERGAEPHLHEHAGAQDRVGQTALLEVPLDAPLRRAKRALHFEVPGERHVDELADAGPARGIDELQLAVLVDAADRVIRLARERGRGRRNDRRRAATCRVERRPVLEVALDDLRTEALEPLDLGGVGGLACEGADRLCALAEAATNLAAEQAGRTNDEYHCALLAGGRRSGRG